MVYYCVLLAEKKYQKIKSKKKNWTKKRKEKIA
jgi:hypothetical protein